MQVHGTTGGYEGGSCYWINSAGHFRPLNRVSERELQLEKCNTSKMTEFEGTRGKYAIFE